MIVELDRGVFFFKQKTAYVVRISDWSSDVCSSDLAPGRAGPPGPAGRPDGAGRHLRDRSSFWRRGMTLNTPVIRLLVAKDWQLFQTQLAFYVLAGIVASCFLGLAKPWAFYVGSLMLLIVMVSAAFFSISNSLMVEHKEQTLAFRSEA